MSRFSATWNVFKNYGKPVEMWGKDLFYNAFGFAFGGQNLENLIKQGFQSNTNVYSIINRIAETAADIPIIIEVKRPGSDKIEILTEGEYFDFVHNPNPDTNYKNFKYQSIVMQLATGNVIQYGVTPTGFTEIAEAWNLFPQFMGAETISELTGVKVKKYIYSPNGGNWDIEPEKIMHLKKFNPNPSGSDGWMGMSPLQAAYRTLITSNETLTAAASLISNKGSAGMLTSRSDRALTTPEKKMMDEALKGRIGGASEFGSIKVTSGNFDFIKMAMSPHDLKLIEMGVLTLRDLCSVFGAKSRMFNDPKGSSFNNAKQDSKDFYLNAVLPPSENDTDHWNRFYGKGWNEKDGVIYTVKLDTSGIDVLQEDQKEQIEKSRKRSEIIRETLKGISLNMWTELSAIEQLMDTLKMTEDEANKIVDTRPVIVEPVKTPTND